MVVPVALPQAVSRTRDSIRCGTSGCPPTPTLRARLKALGFRYVVWHKFSGMFVGGRVSTGMLAQPNGPPTPLAQHPIFRDAFAGTAPIHEDALVVVYAIE